MVFGRWAEVINKSLGKNDEIVGCANNDKESLAG